MTDDHYAIVVGLSGYPLLGEPPPSDLRGPVNDARRVFDWLTDPMGGALDPANVRLITTPDPMPSSGAPERDQIQSAFQDLAIKAESARTSMGAMLGRRLYVYVAGHGFSPGVSQGGGGCLLAGNAGGIVSGANVYVTRWLEHFQDAGYFHETVLWMDCCMNRDARDLPSLPTVQARVSARAPGPSFTAFAARRPLRAVEADDGSGRFHGVFTTVLLEGLRGAAVNSYGMVTGRSLADWLRNAQRARLTDADLADPRVSKEPDIIREDPAIVFVKGSEKTRFPVELVVPGGVKGAGRLWSGRPAAEKSCEFAVDGRIVLDLVPGLYLFDVPDRGLRQGFEVAGPTTITITATGPSVEMRDVLVPVSIRPDDPTAEIYLVDEAFGLVDSGMGELSTKVPPGIYKTRIRSGDRLAEEVYLLDRPPDLATGRQEGLSAPTLPPLASAVPFPDTRFTHEYHEEVLRRLPAAAPPDSWAELVLVSRIWRPGDHEPVELPPEAHLELWSGDRILGTPSSLVYSGQGPDPIQAMIYLVQPGTYYIRRRIGDRMSEQPLVALPGWRTTFFFLLTPESCPQDTPPHCAILMHEAGKSYEPAEDLRVLQAEGAVGRGRALLSIELRKALIDQPVSPIAALLGAHLLILEEKKRPSGLLVRLPWLVERLRTMFAGVPSGDVEALLAFTNPAGRYRISMPPLLRASWDLISEGTFEQPDLLPPELYHRMFATQPGGAFLSWATDEASRRRFLEQLRTALPVMKPGPALPVATHGPSSAGIYVSPGPFRASPLSDFRVELPRPSPERWTSLGKGLSTVAPGYSIGLPATVPTSAPQPVQAEPQLEPVADELLSPTEASLLRSLGLPASARGL